MIVFDVTDTDALNNLNQYWLPKILENADENIELALVANKIDLINQRVIDKKMIQKFVKHNSFLQDSKRISESDNKRKYEETVIDGFKCYEISAREPKKVEAVFKSLLTQVISNKNTHDRILFENQPERVRLSVHSTRPKFKGYQGKDNGDCKC